MPKRVGGCGFFYKMKNLDKEILNVLVIAGNKGLKVEKIARHVYNACNSIFTPLEFREVHAYVTQYLIKNSKNPNSIIEKGKGYGVYHINYQSSAVQQLMFNFASSEAEALGEDAAFGKGNSGNADSDKRGNGEPRSLFDDLQE